MRLRSLLLCLALFAGLAITSPPSERMVLSWSDSSGLHIQAAQSYSSLPPDLPPDATLSRDARASILTTYDDPQLYAQWGLTRLDYREALSTHDATGEVVAVVDTGVDASHPDLQGVVLPGYSAIGSNPHVDPNGHGTHVAGIVAALGNNSQGGMGLAQGAKILPVQVLSADGSGYDSDIARGVVWAANHGADVINLSLGSPDDTPALRSAVSYAESHGVVVVAAAGNSALDGNPVFYPAAYPGVLAVAAAGMMDSHAMFSETGSYVSLAAPGIGILSTWPGGQYQYESGTSMAAPFVSASAALTRATHPQWSASQVTSRLLSSAQDIGSPGRDDQFGAGMVDPLAAMTNGVPTPPSSSLPAPSLPTPSLPSNSLPTPSPLPPGTLPASPLLPSHTLPTPSPLPSQTPAMPHPGKPRTKDALILSSAQEDVVYGTTLTLTAEYLDSALHPIPDKEVDLYTRAGSGAWMLAARAATGTSGKVAFQGDPGVSAEYYLSSGTLSSTTLRVSVSPRLSLSRTDSSLTGRAAPGGGSYTLEVLKGGSWEPAATTSEDPYRFTAPLGPLYRLCAAPAGLLAAGCSTPTS